MVKKWFGGEKECPHGFWPAPQIRSNGTETYPYLNPGGRGGWWAKEGEDRWGAQEVGAEVSYRTLVCYLVLAAGLTIAYFSSPGRTLLLWASLGLSSVLALVVGIRRYRPEQRLPWYLLAAAVTSFAAGDLVDNLLTSVLHQNNALLSAADVFHLAMYPLCAAALALFIRSRTPWADLSSLLDALIITVGVGLLSWVYLIEPFVHSAQLTWPQKLIWAAYPLGDVLLLALLARLLSAGGFQVLSLRLLTFATCGLLTADVIYGLTRLNGTWAAGGRVDGGWLLFYVLLGATALHPSMVQMTVPLATEAGGYRAHPAAPDRGSFAGGPR